MTSLRSGVKMGLMKKKNKLIFEPISREESDRLHHLANEQFQNAKSLLKKFNVNEFLKSIHISKKYPNFNYEFDDIEKLIGRACGIDEQFGQIYGGFYCEEHSNRRVKLYTEDFLKDGSIFSKLDKSLEFIPIAYIIGYGEQEYEAVEIIVGYLYSTRFKFSFFTYYQVGLDEIGFFIFAKKISSPKKNISKILKKIFFQSKKKWFGFENTLNSVDWGKYVILNKDLKWNSFELKKTFKSVLDKRKFFKKIHLEEQGDPKDYYNLPIYFLRQKNFLLIPNLKVESNGGFNRTPKFIKSKLKKPSIVLKV
jgi:hypothetical protein